MAAAEARTAWQRTVNRCFVQEDAKRAPKLACNQSSASMFKQVDAGPPSTVDGSDSPGIGFMAFNRNPSHFNLPPEARWWLQLDPNFEHQKGFTCGQIKAFEVDGQTSGVGDVNYGSKVDGFKTLDGSLEPSHCVNRFVSKKGDEVKMEELSGKCKIDHDFIDVKELTDYYELMEMELLGGSVSKQSSDLSCEKIPWWRKTDKDDLASFVEQKSLHLIENCDLPLTRKMNVKGELSEQYSKSVDYDEMFVSLQDRDQSDATSGLYTRANAHAGSKRGSDMASGDRDVLSESVATGHLSMNYTEMIDKPRQYGEDSSKAKILEALCHSQTRAREAEEAAKQAFIEKEHIVKLFFKQASQLFAYKQWFRLLQLESSLLQKKNNPNYRENSFTPSPDAYMPWDPCKPTPSRHNIWRKTGKGNKRRKRGLPGCDICKYAIAFALGLSLVGAGLLMGWTIGWLFPAF